jgi:flagellin-like protein
MKLKGANEGVSEVIGTVLLLGMAISFFSILSYTVLSYPSAPSSPSANLVATKDGDHLLIEHRGGEALTLDTKVIITFSNGTSKSMAIGDKNYLDDKAKEDNLWGLGELFIYQDKNITSKTVSIAVVDVKSNSRIMTGLLNGN